MPDIVHLTGDAAIHQYSDYNVHLEMDLDLTGYAAEAAMQRAYLDEDPIAFTVDFIQRANPAIVRLSLTAAQTGILTPSTYKWELRVELSGAVRAIAQGNIIVEAGIQ